MGTAAAAMNLATAHKLTTTTNPKPADKKKGEAQADEAGPEQNDGDETGQNDEAEVGDGDAEIQAEAEFLVELENGV